MKQILIATPDDAARKVLAESFRTEGLNIHRERPSEEVLRARPYDFVFIDIDLLSHVRGRQTGQGEEIGDQLQRFWKTNPYAEIIVLAEPGRIRDAVGAVKQGASNYLTYPLSPVEVRFVTESLQAALKLQLEIDYFRDVYVLGGARQVVETRNAEMKQVFDKAKMVADTMTTVLLNGETGVGKGVIAAYIHSLSLRAGAPFVSVHCGAIPETLMESELFGHEKGSFTGATRRQLGRFEVAGEGTVFLDEIGTIDASAQVKLLQVLQDKKFHRLGGDAAIPLKARIVAASNLDLENLCDQGKFRRDLYYRLNVFPIDIPPLRRRPEDIPLLADFFLKSLSALSPKKIKSIHPAVLAAFQSYPWPGNVREMENLIERAFILEKSSVLTPDSFPKEIFGAGRSALLAPAVGNTTLAAYRAQAVKQAERHYLEDLLARHRGRIAATAASAGITPRQVHSLMKKHGLDKKTFRME